MEPQAVSLAEAARVLGVSRGHLRNMARAGQIRVVRLGQRVLVPIAVINDLLSGKANAA